MLSLFNKKKLLGLDIGTNSIKLAELDVGRKKSTLVGFGIIPTPQQAFSGGDIANVQAIGESIRELVKTVKTKRRHVATGLSGTSVIVKRITIPRMEEKLIAEQIRWEAEQYIPYDINEVNLGFEILKKSSTSNENMELLLIAAVQGHVFKYADAIALAGLDCTVLDVCGFALANCFKANYGDMPGQTVALLSIGASATTMVVIDNTEVVFCRDIPVGGLNYTMDLQKGLNITITEAESIKLSMSLGKEYPQEATGLVHATHEVFCEEIKASVDFFLNTTKSNSITRCFVTGGGAKIVGLIDRLSKIMPCEKFDPFYAIQVDKKVFSSAYLDQIRDFAAVAVGLGLRQAGD